LIPLAFGTGRVADFRLDREQREFIFTASARVAPALWVVRLAGSTNGYTGFGLRFGYAFLKCLANNGATEFPCTLKQTWDRSRFHWRKSCRFNDSGRIVAVLFVDRATPTIAWSHIDFLGCAIIRASFEVAL